MESGTNNSYMGVYILDMFAGFALWVILIILKAAGVVKWGWITVLSGLVWLPLIAFAFTVLVAAIVRQIRKLKRWHRRRKNDARIIRQAKAVGVWNTNAGGRALELYAKECGVNRYPGETDAHLRQRIKAEAERGGGGHGI